MYYNYLYNHVLRTIFVPVRYLQCDGIFFKCTISKCVQTPFPILVPRYIFCHDSCTCTNAGISLKIDYGFEFEKKLTTLNCEIKCDQSLQLPIGVGCCNCERTKENSNFSFVHHRISFRRLQNKEFSDAIVACKF